MKPLLHLLGLLAVLSALAPLARAAEPARCTISVDLGAMDLAAYQRLDGFKLDTKVVLRLVEEGFAVVAPGAHPQIALQLTAKGQALQLVALGQDRREVRALAWEKVPLAELHLEITQKAVELARALRASLAPIAPLTAPPIAAPPTTSPPVVLAPLPAIAPAPVPTPQPREPFELALGAEALWRPSAVDPQLRLSGRVPFTHRAGLKIAGSWAPSSAPGLSVNELGFTLGPSVRLRPGAALALDLDAGLGLVFHTFTFDAADAEDPSGTRLELLGEVGSTLWWTPFAPLSLGLRASAGLTQTRVRHLFDGAVLWERGLLRLSGGGALRVEL